VGVNREDEKERCFSMGRAESNRDVAEGPGRRAVYPQSSAERTSQILSRIQNRF
jgi:hypothetical protein